MTNNQTRFSQTILFFREILASLRFVRQTLVERAACLESNQEFIQE